MTDFKNELSEQELNEVSGGDKATTTSAPKETVTFEYGGLNVRYAQQSAS
jgi:bacteriocin-like protein